MTNNTHINGSVAKAPALVTHENPAPDSEQQLTIKNIKSIYTRIRHGDESSTEKLALQMQIGGLLVKERERMRHGQWIVWVTTNLPFSQSTAYNCIRLWRWAMGNEENRANSQ